MLRKGKAYLLKKRNPLINVNSFSKEGNYEKEIYGIPMICYQTWETKLFRKKFAKGITSFHNSNKDFSFILYDSFMRDEYMNSGLWSNTRICKIYNQAIYGVLKADIFRYCILYEKGGVYIDIARKLPKSINSYIKSDCGYSLFFNDHKGTADLVGIQCSKVQLENNLPANRSVINGVLIFRKGHQILNNTIENICEVSKFYLGIVNSPRNSIIQLTGPGAITRAIWDYSNQNQLEKKALNLIDFTNKLYTVKRAELRYLDFPYYGLEKEKAIFNLES